MVNRENRLNISVIGCGRWGSLIAWYLNRIGHAVTLYGREGSAHFNTFLKTRSNSLLTLPESIALSSDLERCVETGGGTGDFYSRPAAAGVHGGMPGRWG